MSAKKHKPSHSSPSRRKVGQAGRDKMRISIPLLLAIILIGLVARLWLLDLGSRIGYKWDQFDNISMGLGTHKVGLLNIYTIDKEDVVVVPGQIYSGGQFHDYDRKPIFAPNYPPLTLAIFWAQTALLPEPIKANTFSARIIMASVPFLAELITAIGVALIAFELFGRRAAIWAGALCWLCPPIILNSTFFLQIDSWVLAPSVFMVWLMMKRRWMLGAVCLGLACLLKPQGLILGPIALFAAIAVPLADGRAGLKEIILRLVKMGVGFFGTIGIITLPWMITTGMAWFQRAYWVSFVEAFPVTTLKAFNIWYLDLLILDGRLASDALNSEAVVLGLAKDLWAKLFTFTAMFVTAGLCLWRYRRTNIAVLIFSALWLWAVFMFPTRVHERFIIYCIPFVVAIGVRKRLLWPALVLLLVFGSYEHTFMVWLKGTPAGYYNPQRQYSGYVANYQRQMVAVPPNQRPRLPRYEEFEPIYRNQYLQGRKQARGREWAMTILSLLAYAAAMIALFAKAPPAQPVLDKSPR